MKVKETMVLGEDFYSLAFYGYYRHPEDQVMEEIEKDSKAVRSLNTIVADKINESANVSFTGSVDSLR